MTLNLYVKGPDSKLQLVLGLCQ